MDDETKPPAPPVGTQPPAQETKQPAAELLPTVRDHAERLGLVPWQVGAIVARLHGTHDEDGDRVFPDGASLTTRMSDEDFDAAADVALHGRV